MSEIRNVLECVNCEGTVLVDTFSYVKLKNQGFAKKAVGAVCLSCGHVADQGTMNRKMDLRRRARELEALQEEAERIEMEQAALDQKAYEDDPVKTHDLVITRAKAKAAAKKSKDS